MRRLDQLMSYQRNASMQHPYFSWISPFQRIALDFFPPILLNCSTNTVQTCQRRGAAEDCDLWKNIKLGLTRAKFHYTNTLWCWCFWLDCAWSKKVAKSFSRSIELAIILWIIEQHFFGCYTSAFNHLWIFTFLCTLQNQAILEDPAWCQGKY